MCGEITEAGVFLGHVMLTQGFDSFSGDLNMAVVSSWFGVLYLVS